MYTSISPVSDRFGFRLKSTFRGAYKNENLIIIAGLIILGVTLVLYGGSVAAFGNLFDEKGAITGGMFDVVFESGETRVQATEGFIGFSMFFLTTEAFIIVMAAETVIFLAVLGILHAGRKYGFEANENGMTITCPKGITDAYRYKDVNDVFYTERKIFLGTRGYDIVVTLNNKRKYFYRLIHSHSSKTEGITGTPFNILLERVAMAKTGYVVDDMISEE